MRIAYADPGDEFCDLFPGTGAVSAAWEALHRSPRLVGGSTIRSQPQE